jgi:TatD DNase family protein
MFDSHCHLDADEYDRDRDEVLARARASGLTGILVPGFEPTEWHTLKALCARDELLCCAVGLHPWYVHELDESARVRTLDTLPEVLREQGAVAVGECGLDALKAKRGGAPMDVQRAVLARHVAVARELGLPLVLHCVRAHGAMLELLEAGGPLAQGGVLHSYGGPPDLIGRYARLGLSFSFAGSVLREEARKNRAALAAVPLDRLLVESDGPDQAAEPGGRSEPCDILRVLAVAAQLRPESSGALARAVSENARALFGLARER